MCSLITLDLRKEDDLYDDGEMLGCILRFYLIATFGLPGTTTVHVTQENVIWNTISKFIVHQREHIVIYKVTPFLPPPPNFSRDYIIW